MTEIPADHSSSKFEKVVYINKTPPAVLTRKADKAIKAYYSLRKPQTSDLYEIATILGSVLVIPKDGTDIQLIIPEQVLHWITKRFLLLGPAKKVSWGICFCLKLPRDCRQTVSKILSIDSIDVSFMMLSPDTWCVGTSILFKCPL